MSSIDRFSAKITNRSSLPAFYHENVINLIFDLRKEMIARKIRTAGQETTDEQISAWNSNLSELERLIDYHKNLSDDEILKGDYSEVDWVKIAKVDVCLVSCIQFLGNRTPRQLRLKWVNELCPKWSKEPWSAQEIEQLRKYAGKWNNWNVIAERLGTNRTPFQCFVKYRSELEIENTGRPWTKEEDAQLMTLAHCMQVNGHMHWEKISHFMETRSRQQCSCRYKRTLDTSIKFGRWDASEDVILTCAVSRFGTKDWIKVASHVPGRSDSQCRDRWVNVLDKSIKSEPWSLEEDEKLLEGIKIFGKGEWSRISTLIPGRSASHCKSRFRSLFSAKVKLASHCRSYPLKRFNWRGKHRRQEVEETFRKLLAADGLVEQVLNSFDIEGLSVDEMEAFSAMAPEQRKTAIEFFSQIRETNLETEENNEEAIYRLLSDKLQFDINYLDSSMQNVLMKHFKKLFEESTGTLLTDEEKYEFDMRCKILQETDEKGAKDHIVDGLCDLIKRNDTKQCIKRQTKFVKSEILDEISRYLRSVLINDINEAVATGVGDFALPPCIETYALSLRFGSAVIRSISIGKIFSFVFVFPTYSGMRQIYISTSTVEIFQGEETSIYPQLSEKIIFDPEYVLLKAKMRVLLFWPMLLYRAIESEDSVENRMHLRSVGAAKLVELEQQAKNSNASQNTKDSVSKQSLVQTDAEDEALMIPSCSANLSVREFLKRRLLKQPRKYLCSKKMESESENVGSSKQIVPEFTELMSRHIDECIESVCMAVKKIYERDFVTANPIESSESRIAVNLSSSPAVVKITSDDNVKKLNEEQTEEPSEQAKTAVEIRQPALDSLEINDGQQRRRRKEKSTVDEMPIRKSKRLRKCIDQHLP
ncbi:unnamed protein product [Thelazia callipaeda]|uniref:Myb-like DNA-binding domain protein n=1 Tax=Thelazia callipaeda TaxID=103827 RepID=A0A0N5D4T4_THECL|nr:unnamed protein product [Thelazia callipaeda]